MTDVRESRIVIIEVVAPAHHAPALGLVYSFHTPTPPSRRNLSYIPSYTSLSCWFPST